MEWMTIAGILIFGFLSLLHFYWAFSGQPVSAKVIPVIEGRKSFEPGMFLTILVALALAVCGMVLWVLGFYSSDNFPFFDYVVIAGWVLSAIFLLRAIGDFNSVGVFKKNKNSEFAKYDTLFYSPLCFVLSMMFLLLLI